MADPAKVEDQNILPVQALFNLDNSFNTFIGQGQPFYATVNPSQSGLHITNSTIDSTTIGATAPSTGVFTNVSTTTGTISTSPVGNTDITNKAYVDSVTQGLNPKQAVKCATTGAITLSGLQTIDTYTTLAGDRVLVKNQGTQSENGIYIAASGAWVRSTDMDVWSEVPGAYTVVLNGSTNANTSWVSTSADTGTINVTPITFVQFSGSGTYYAGTGLTLASNTFSITNTGVTAATKGSASKTVTATVNAQGQLTSLTDQDIAISASQITSGILGGANGGTGVNNGANTLTWNASYTLNQSVASGASPAFAGTNFSSIPNSALTYSSITVNGTAISLGGSATITAVNPNALTIGSGLSGTSYNGSAAVTITNTAPMVYPASGIPSSTGTAWGSSYSTTGTGSVVALATAATLNNPTISDYTAYTPTTAPSYAEGRVFYDSAAHTLNYYNDNSQMSLNIGQEQVVRVRNQTGSTILNGTVVYISGATGQTPLVTKAIATSYTTADVIGVTTTDITNNGFGYVTISGTVNDLDTSSFADGDAVYLSASVAGAYTATEPTTPNYSIQIGVITYSNNVHGKLLVAIQTKSVEVQHIIGTLPIANGGTNGTATPTAGAVAYGTGTAYAFNSAGTTGQVLTSNGSSAPTWTNPSASIAITDDTTTNAVRYPLFSTATSGSISTEYTSSTKYQFNPSTGTLAATIFSGSGASLTNIPNAALTNSSVTIGSTSVSLGATATTLAGLTSVTSTTFVGALSGNASTATSATTATNATNVAITDNTTSSSTFYPVISAVTTGNTGATTSSTKLSFTPSTGTLTATSFSGNGSNLTGVATTGKVIAMAIVFGG